MVDLSRALSSFKVIGTSVLAPVLLLYMIWSWTASSSAVRSSGSDGSFLFLRTYNSLLFRVICCLSSLVCLLSFDLSLRISPVMLASELSRLSLTAICWLSESSFSWRSLTSIWCSLNKLTFVPIVRCYRRGSVDPFG